MRCKSRYVKFTKRGRFPFEKSGFQHQFFRKLSGFDFLGFVLDIIEVLVVVVWTVTHSFALAARSSALLTSFSHAFLVGRRDRRVIAQ
jgi:hypothetical protein